MWLPILLLSFVLATPAQAILITLEPDDYAVGTDVTNLFDGVTLHRYTDNRPLTPVVLPSSNQNTPATGTQAFGDFHGTVYAAQCWTNGTCERGFSVLVLQFSQPTNYVEVASSWGASSGDDPVLYFFDANRQLIQAAQTRPGDYLRYRPLAEAPPDVNVGDFASIVRFGSVDQAPFIHSAILGGWETFNTVDRIRYNSVPEPSVLLLLSLAISMFYGMKFIRPVVNH